MTKKWKKKLLRVIVGAVIFFFAVMVTKLVSDLRLSIQFLLFLAAYIIIGGEIVKKAVLNIGKGQIFDENFLMSIATIGAFLVSDYAEAVVVMLFYQVGELFQAYAVNRSRKSIADLMDIRPDYAWVERSGEFVQEDPFQVKIGEKILVKPGEKVPLDGVLIKGSTALDTMALTGESMPRDAVEGDEIISGCINISGLIEIQVTKNFEESTVAKILDLVENASSKKAEAENFISKFAKYYTPIVVLCAAALAIIPPLIMGNSFSEWIYRALTFLVISCPCALVISIPLSFFGGLGGAGKIGVLVKGSNYLEALANVETVVMDKTGTLTKGNFKVTEIEAKSGLKDELLELTAYAECHSNHPISVSLKEAYGKEIDTAQIGTVEEIPGFGVKTEIRGSIISAGNTKLMESLSVSYSDVKEIGTVVHVAKDNEYLGYLVIADEIKEDAKTAITAMKKEGIKNIVMLTGDRKETADYVAKELGITQTYSQLLPSGKVEQVEELLRKKEAGKNLIFVGDGVNDAPVLARADIGIAMGGLGSDAAIEAADIVIMTDEPSKIAKAIQISRKTLVIVKQNIIFAIGVKVLVLILAAMGMTNMWAAIFADVGVSFIAIINSMRTLGYASKWKNK